MSIIIDKEFESLIPPLSEDEFAQLEENCMSDGIRDPLVVWEHDGNDVLVDGHNRFKIVGKHPTLQFNIRRIDFADRDEVKAWIRKNQLGRRNIDRWVKFDIAKELEAYERKKAKERQIRKSSDSVMPTLAEQKGSTRDKLAEMVGVSHGTLAKMKAIDESGNEQLKQQVRSGEKSIHRGWTDLQEKERRQTDLSAKAHLEKAEERHKDFTESKTVSIADVAQDKKDSAEIARSRYNEIYNAIKKILFIGASNFDYSIISTKTMSNDEIRRLQGELNISIGVLKRICDEIGGSFST